MQDYCLFQEMFNTHPCQTAQVFLIVRVHGVASGDSWQIQTLQCLTDTEQDCKLDIHYTIYLTRNNKRVNITLIYLIKSSAELSSFELDSSKTFIAESFTIVIVVSWLERFLKISVY